MNDEKELAATKVSEVPIKVSKIVTDVAANGFEVLKDLTGVDLSKVINDFVNKNSQSIEPKTEIIDAKTTNVDND